MVADNKSDLLSEGVILLFYYIFLFSLSSSFWRMERVKIEVKMKKEITFLMGGGRVLQNLPSEKQIKRGRE